MTKYQEVAETVKQRILSGDYALKRPPSGRVLAAETGVSYLTARRAVQHLLEEGVLVQKTNGRLEINDEFQRTNRSLQVAVVCPNWNAPGITKWTCSIREVVEAHGGILKTVAFSHTEDPIIHDVLDSDFDLIFLSLMEMTPSLERKLDTVGHKVINMFKDWTEYGVNGIDGAHPSSLRVMGEYLRDLGHKRIGLLATEPGETGQDARIQAWEAFAPELGLETVRMEDRVEPFGFADERAYDYMSARIAAGEIDYTALFVTSAGTARAAMRAFYEAGYEIGKDISICSFGDTLMAKLSIPSLTVLDVEDVTPQIREAIDYVLGGYEEAKMFRAECQDLLIGESTGPAPAGK